MAKVRVIMDIEVEEYEGAPSLDEQIEHVPGAVDIPDECGLLEGCWNIVNVTASIIER